MSSTIAAAPTGTDAAPPASSTPAGPPPPQNLITDDDKSALIEVVTLMFMVLSILACLVRTGTKLYMIKTVKWDDILVIIATVVAIAQSVTVIIGTGTGLGQRYNTLDSSQSEGFLKVQYAASLLFIVAIGLTKVSGAMSIHNMAQNRQKIFIRICEIVCAIWSASAFFVVLFGCEMPAPWNYTQPRKCIDRTAFWTYYSAFNIVSDLAIISLVITNVRHIQTSWAKKALVMGVFGSRILVTPAIIAQIYLTERAGRSTDYSFAVWDSTVAIELVQCLALVTVCIPNLKPFLDSLESGQIRIDDMRRQGKSSNGYPAYRAGYAGYKGAQHSGHSRSRNPQSRNIDTLTSQRSDIHEMTDIPKSRGAKGVAVTTDEPAWDGRSHTSQSSQTILIQQTKTWHVDVEHSSPAPLPVGTDK